MSLIPNRISFLVPRKVHSINIYMPGIDCTLLNTFQRSLTRAQHYFFQLNKKKFWWSIEMRVQDWFVVIGNDLYNIRSSTGQRNGRAVWRYRIPACEYCAAPPTCASWQIVFRYDVPGCQCKPCTHWLAENRFCLIWFFHSCVLQKFWFKVQSV